MDISIIIPIYNVEEFLADCLDSVKKGLGSLQAEVLLVDDGSTDTSGQIADEYAAKDPVFKVFHKPNGGPGSARNYGVAKARGKYIQFIDADDLVTPGIFEDMFRLAERNQSELTICYMAKYTDKKAERSYIHQVAFHPVHCSVTTLKESPTLVFDSTPVNKLILRSYYLEHQFTFPVGCFFEDILAVFPIQYYANSISVIPSVGYLWRTRSGKSTSTSQSIFDTSKLDDKILMLRRLFSFIDSLPDGEEYRTMAECKAVMIDFDRHLVGLYLMEPEAAAAYVHKIAVFFREVIRPDVTDYLRLASLQIYEDVLAEDVEHLIRVLHHRRLNYDNAPYVDCDGELELVLPEELYPIRKRSIENEYRFVPPNVLIAAGEISGSTLTLRGHLYYRRIPVDRPDAQTVTAVLYHEQTGEKISLPCTVIRSEYLTREQGIFVNHDDYRDYRCNYDYAGFEIRLDFSSLGDIENLRGKNLIYLTYSHREYAGSCLLKNIRDPLKKQLNGKRIPVNAELEAKLSFPRFGIFTVDLLPRLPAPQQPQSGGAKSASFARKLKNFLKNSSSR